MKNFGERLRKLRRHADMTQSDLAKKLGVVTSAVGKYEGIDGSYPSVEVLVKIAECFNVSTDYLLRGIQVVPVFENNITGTLNTGSFIQANNGDVTVDKSRTLSPEVSELLRIYGNLNGQKRIALLACANRLSDSSAEVSA